MYKYRIHVGPDTIPYIECSDLPALLPITNTSDKRWLLRMYSDNPDDNDWFTYDAYPTTHFLLDRLFERALNAKT